MISAKYNVIVNLIADWERAIRRTVIHELWDRLRQCILIPADDPEFGLDKLLNVQ